MSQTSYPLKMLAAKEGMLADNGPKDITSGVCATNLLVGKFTALDASGAGVIKHPTVAAEITGLKANGVVMSSHDCEQSGLAADVVLATKEANILRKGRIYVKPEDKANMTIGMQVSIRYAGIGDKGAFVCTPVANETALLPNAKYVEIHGDYAIVELNIA